MHRRTFLAFLAVAMLAAPSPAAQSRVIRGVVPADKLERVAITVAVGDVRVVPAQDDAVHVTVRLTPRRGGLFGSIAAARRQVDEAELAADRQGSTLDLRIRTTGENPKFEAAWDVALPPSLALKVDAGVGDLAIRGTRADLEIHDGVGDVTIRASGGRINVKIGVGDLTVRAPAAAYGAISASTGVGDAELEGAGGTVSGKGMIAKSLRWSGSGPGAMALATGVGDIVVRLTGQRAGGGGSR